MGRLAFKLAAMHAGIRPKWDQSVQSVRAQNGGNRLQKQPDLVGGFVWEDTLSDPFPPEESNWRKNCYHSWVVCGVSCAVLGQTIGECHGGNKFRTTGVRSKSG
jgi:hypothetical protein